MSKPELEKAYEEARSIKVKEIMSKPVITAAEDEHLSDVVVKMLENNIHRVPVVRDDKPVGIISRHDLLKLVAGKLKSKDWA
jgi:CBS domain-containing protein